jgi:4-hydroxybenzoate polyprenyltransferase
MVGVVASGGNFGIMQFFQIFMLSFPLSLYLYGINDAYDIRTDSINLRKKEGIWGQQLKEGEVAEVVKFAMISGILVFLGSILTLNVIAIASTAAFLLIMYFYSAPPLRFKSRPLLDSIVNAAYLLGPFAMGYSIFGGFGFLNPFFLLFALNFSAAHAIVAIMDVNQDKESGIGTIATEYGGRLAALFAACIFLANVPFSYMMMHSGGFVLGAYTLIALALAYAPTPTNAKKAGMWILVVFFIWVTYAIYAWQSGLEGVNLTWLNESGRFF